MQFCAGASGSQKDVASDLALFPPVSLWPGESIPLLVIKLHLSSALIRVSFRQKPRPRCLSIVLFQVA